MFVGYHKEMDSRKPDPMPQPLKQKSMSALDGSDKMAT